MPRKIPTKTRMKHRLDKAVREYVKARDGYCCQTCGIHRDSTPLGQLDWSHKIGRNHLILRWDERNTISQCRKCHNDWERGITLPMNQSIDRLFGEGAAQMLENMARQYPISKGTYLDLVEFRMTLEDYYKKKLRLVRDEGYTQSECIANLYTDFGLKIKGKVE
jgi:hydrogenase maturation factor HypF (carbamoyltransferase family)